MILELKRLHFREALSREFAINSRSSRVGEVVGMEVSPYIRNPEEMRGFDAGDVVWIVIAVKVWTGGTEERSSFGIGLQRCVSRTEAAKWRLSLPHQLCSSSSDTAAIVHWWPNLTLLKIKHWRSIQVFLGAWVDYFPTSLIQYNVQEPFQIKSFWKRLFYESKRMS